MHTINAFIARITSWNRQRYAQEYNQDLTVDLLYEEIGELNEATTDVDRLDALVDVTYIAIGAMWKLGLSEPQIVAAIHAVCDANASKRVDSMTPSHIKANLDKGPDFIAPEPRLQEILNDRFNHYTS